MTTIVKIQLEKEEELQKAAHLPELSIVSSAANDTISISIDYSSMKQEIQKIRDPVPLLALKMFYGLL